MITSKHAALMLAGAALGSLMLVGTAANLVLGAAPRPSAQPVLHARQPLPAPPLGLGLDVLEASQARAMGVETGLRVERATGSAYERGLRAGDVIVRVNGRAVSSVEAFWDSVAAARWQATLTVLRDGKPRSMRLADVDGEGR